MFVAIVLGLRDDGKLRKMITFQAGHVTSADRRWGVGEVQESGKLLGI